ncbi:MAG: MarR family winged helix-turn-helix transcriptional regulator [Stellaceae bacterium]
MIETDLMPTIIADTYELAGAFRARGEAIAAAIGQSQARWQVLSAASGEPLTVPQIARRLGVTRQAVQRIADLLVADGLARYVANPDHKASLHLILTDAGEAVLATLTRGARASHEAMSAKLQDIDLAALRRDLRRLLIALNGPRKFDHGE